MRDKFEIKTNIEYSDERDSDVYKLFKFILDQKKVLVINSIGAIMTKEILEQNYNIKNIYISNEKVFLSLSGFIMKKSLPERIYLKINLL